MAEQININAYQKAIETIVSQRGFSVVQVFFNDVTAYYYAVHKFTPAAKTPTDDIQYNQVIGINITNFIQNNSLVGIDAFLHKFDVLMSDPHTEVLRLEFPNTIKWFKFAPATR